MRLRAPRSAVVLGLVAGTLSALPGPAPAASASPPARPDVVIVMTDDQRFDSLGNCLPSFGAPNGPGSVACMPNVRSLLQNHGITFQQSFVTTSVCCPSRSSFLTGLYTHNHRVYTNEKPTGGYEKSLTIQDSTLPVWLEAEGYRTGLYGKYLNGYYGPEEPPGWDEWHAMYGSSSESYQNFKLVENGVVNNYSHTYHTTVVGQKAVQFIDSTPSDQPLFLYFAPHAPHYPYTPAKGDVRSYEHMPPWRPPSFQEADVSDKSPYWQTLGIRDATFVANRDRDHYRQLATLKEVDRQIGNIVTALGPRLSNTLFVFTSDNGLAWGEHRAFEQKGCEFEECARVPLVVRFDPLTGGGASVDSTHPVLNVDLAATVMAAAGAAGPAGMDGRSFLPLLAGSPPADWRTSVLGENFGSMLPVDEKWPASNAYIETFADDPDGAGYKYVEACDRADKVLPCAVTFSSFYDENVDPDELCNLLSPVGCGPAPPAGLVQSLTARLHALQAAAPPTVDFDPVPASSLSPVKVSFGGSGVSAFRCAVDGDPLEPCQSPIEPDGQSHGPHELVVAGDGPGGTAAPATVRWWISDLFPETPTFTSTPPSASPFDVQFSFTDSDPGVVFLCALDGAEWSTCTSPAPLTGLSVGDHTFAVAALDAAGNLSTPATHTWLVQDDVTPPTLAMKKPADDELLASRKVLAQWSGTDDGSGLDRFEVTRRSGIGAPGGLVFSGIGNSFTITIAPSGTYCFRVTAFDREGNSAVGPERCSAVPLDDRELVYTGPTTLAAPSAAFDSTVTRMTGAGSTMFTFTGRRYGVLFRKGPDLGKAIVTVDGGTSKVVNLWAERSKLSWWSRVLGPSAPHTVRIAWTGQKDADSTGTDVAVDGVAAIAESAPQPS